MSLLLSLRLSESTKCRSNLQLALLAIAVLSNQVLWKKCALVFALNGLSNWMPISGGIFQQKVMISSIKSTIFFVMWFVFYYSHIYTFFQRDSIPILVSRTVKTRKFKLLYFRNETCFGSRNLYKELFFVYLRPSVNKNS